MSSASRRKTSIALVLVAIMVSAPILAIQTGLIENLNDLNGKSLSGEATCTEAKIWVTEVYPGDDGWIELYNNDNSDCDLGGYSMGDVELWMADDRGVDFADDTVIGSKDYLVLDYNTDFSFYIDSDYEVLFFTRPGVDLVNSDDKAKWNPTSTDQYSWDSSRDGSWERCFGVYDWNEPGDVTPGAANSCNGDPLVLIHLHDSSEVDDAILNESIDLAWSLDNLPTGMDYEIHYSWETAFGSFSDSTTFTHDGGKIEFSLQSMVDYTCFAKIQAELKEVSSGTTIEFFNRNLNVESCVDQSNFRIWDLSTSPDTPIHNPSQQGSGANEFRCIPICAIPDTNGDGIPDGADDVLMSFELENPTPGVTYNILAFVYSDDEVQYLFDETFTPDYSAEDWVNDWSWEIAGYECDLRITYQISIVVNAILWALVDDADHHLEPACDGNAREEIKIITLEALGDAGWGDLPETLDTGELKLRWDLGSTTEDQKVRFKYFYNSETTGYDRAYENRRLLNDGYVYWNITVDEFGSSRYIEAWFYHVSVTGLETLTDYHYSSFSVNDHSDGGEAILYSYVDHYDSAYDQALENGSTAMYWNLTELVPGYEYMIEWATSHDGVYRNYSIHEWTPTSSEEVISWVLTRDGSSCNVYVDARLHVKSTNQEWHSSDRQSWHQVDHYGRNYAPTCSDEEDSYKAATLKILINGSWTEVPDTLEPGSYQMFWDLDLEDGTPYQLYDYSRPPYRGWTDCHWWKQDTDAGADECYRYRWRDGERSVGQNRKFIAGEQEDFYWNLTVNSFGCSLYVHYWINIDGMLSDWRVEDQSTTHDIAGKPLGCDAGFEPGSQEGSSFYQSTISAGNAHTCSIMSNGSISCWGDNSEGQLGLSPEPSAIDWTLVCPPPSSDGEDPIDGYTFNVYSNLTGQLVGTCSNAVGSPDWPGSTGNTYFSNFTASDIDLYCYTNNMSVTLGVTLEVNGTDILTWDTCGSDAADYGTETLVEQLQVWEFWPLHPGGGVNGTLQSESPVHIDLPDRVAAWGSAYSNSAWDISAGEVHTCAILYNGSVGCWGDNAHGQLGDGTTTDSSEVVMASTPEDLPAVALSSGAHHTCAVFEDGSAYCWGANSYGQLGDGTEENRISPTEVTLPEGRLAVAIASGYTHSCATLDNGSVMCWGANSYGQLGDGSYNSSNSPVYSAISDGLSATAVVIGYQTLDSHSCALLDDGSIACWGFNEHGQLGDGTTVNRETPVMTSASSGQDIVAISAGSSHTCAILQNRSMGCWGLNSNSQTGALSGASPTQVSTIQLGGSAVGVSAGSGHTCAMLDNYTVSCWGDNSFGQLGQGSMSDSISNSSTPLHVSMASSTDTGDIDPDRDGILTPVDSDPLNAQLPVTADDAEVEMMVSNMTWNTIETVDYSSRFSSGYGHTCAIVDNGSAVCWGQNDDNELGNSNMFSRDIPTHVGLPAGRSAIAIAAGDSHSCAILDNASVECWGDSSYGQLGPGDGSGFSVGDTYYVEMPDGSPVTAISAGAYYTCAILENGSVACWGDNGYGQLGAGEGSNQDTPVLVDLPDGRTAQMISSGQDHNCAILDNGSAVCWGSNSYGQLGDGTFTTRFQPTFVDSQDQFVAISPGQEHTCGILDNGSAVCWGSHTHGQLGDGPTNRDPPESNQPVFVDLPTGRTASAIDSGMHHTCAILDNSSAYCWGLNDGGQLGDGSAHEEFAPGTDSNTPVFVEIPSGRTPMAITAGNVHTCAVLDNSSAVCWGENEFGQLGDGTTTSRNGPSYVSSVPEIHGYPDTSSILFSTTVTVHHFNNQVEDLDDVDSIVEGTTTLRWRVDDISEGFDYFVHIRLYYNNYLQDYEISRFFSESTDDVTGEWQFSLSGEICNLRFYSELWVNNPSGWDRLEYHDDYVDYAGGDDCYYHYENEFKLFVEQSDGTWMENPDSLEQGANHVYFETDGLNLKEGVWYYINGYFEGEGTGNVYNNNHFYVGDVWPVAGRHFHEDHSVGYSGEDLHLNFTMYDWTCESKVRAHLNYYTPSHHSYRIAEYSGSRSEFDIANCDSAGEMHFSKQGASGEWSDGYNQWEIDVGTSQLSWNLTDLDIAENYKLIFSVQVDRANVYSNTQIEFTPYLEDASFPFSLTIDENVCYVHGWARLYIEIPDYETGFYDGNFQEVEYANFHADEPCIPHFDILAEDLDGEWQNPLAGYLLSNGTTQMMFNLSGLAYDDYYIGYHWNNPSNSSGDWVYEYVSVDGQGSESMYWNLTMLDDDCSTNLDVQLYRVNYWGNNDHIQSYDLDLPGPCILPFTLSAFQGNQWIQEPESVSVGANLLRWNLTNLIEGQDYYLNWYYTNHIDNSQWNNSLFNHTGEHVEFYVPASQWSCDIYLYAELDIVINGTHTRLKDESFNVDVDGCVDGGDIDLAVYSEEGWDDSPPDYAIDNGTSQLKWIITNMEADYDYSFEWIVWKNGDIVSYDHEGGMFGIAEEFQWQIYVNEEITCDVRAFGRLMVDSDQTSGTRWINVQEFNDYFYPDCSDDVDFYPISIQTQQDDGTWSEDDNLEMGVNAISLIFDDLEEDAEYQVHYSISTSQGYYSHTLNRFSPSDISNYQFNISVNEFDCDVRLYYHSHVFSEVSGSWHVGSREKTLHAPCVSSSEVALERLKDGEWDDDPDSDDLSDGNNEMLWNLTDLADDYEYGLEWSVKFNDQFIDYGHQKWIANSSQDAVHWNLTLDMDSVCNVYVWARLSINTTDGGWTEFDSFDQNFYPDCESEERFDHVSLSANVNGSTTGVSDWLPSGDTEMSWDTSNLMPGYEYTFWWGISTSDSWDNHQVSFTSTGSEMFNWTHSSNIWSCQSSIEFWVYLQSPISGSHWVDGETLYVQTDCIDVEYNWSLDPSAQVEIGNSSSDYTSDQLVNSTSILVNISGIQDQFPYYGELKVYGNGDLLHFLSEYWYAEGDDHIIELPLTEDWATCDVDIMFDLYVDTPNNYWTQVIDTDLDDLTGDCSDSYGGPAPIFELQLLQGGEWVGESEDSFSIESGTNQMRWVTSSLDEDSEYHVYFYDGVSQGYTQQSSGIMEIYWNLTIDHFVCNLEIWIEVSAISEITGWHSLPNQWHNLETQCSDDFGISLEQNGDEMSWNLSSLVGGYNYTLDWSVFSQITAINNDGNGWVQFEETWNSESFDTKQISWTYDIDESECNLEIIAELMVNSTVPNVGTIVIASESIHPEVPCQAPFTVDYYDPDTSSWTNGVTELGVGTSQIFLNFSANEDDDNEWHVGYSWWSESSGSNQYEASIASNSGIFLNITLQETDCKVQIQSEIDVYTDDGSFLGTMGGFVTEMGAPCILPFELGFAENDQESMSVGDNLLEWTFLNLDNNSDYHFEYSWTTHSSGENWFSEYFTYSESNAANLEWNATVFDYDCVVNIYGAIHKNDGTFIYETNLDFEVNDCEADPHIHIVPSQGTLQGGNNTMGFNLSGSSNSHSYLLEWKVYSDGYFTEYHFAQFDNSIGDVTETWHLIIDSATTCGINVESWYHVLDLQNDWLLLDHAYASFSVEDSSCDSPGEYHGVSLWENVNGTPIQDGSLDAGLSEMLWSTSNLVEGQNFLIEWSWNSEEFSSGSGNHEFSSDGSPISFEVTVAPWTCSVEFTHSIYYLDFFGDYHWFNGNSQEIEGPCSSVDMASSDPPTVALFTLSNGTWVEFSSDGAELSNGTTQMMVNLSGLHNGVPYYGQIEVFAGDDLRHFESETWFGLSENRSFLWNLSLDGSECDISIVTSLYNAVNSSGWSLASESVSESAGPCDGTEPVALVPLYALIDNSWELVEDGLFIPNGTTQMFWDLDSLGLGPTIFLHFHADDRHIFDGQLNEEWIMGDGIADDAENFEMGYWNLTIDPFTCEIEIWIELAVISEVTGSHYFPTDYVYPVGDCLDGGDLSLEIDQSGNWTNLQSGQELDLGAGTYQMSWLLDNLEPGYNYTFEWYVHLEDDYEYMPEPNYHYFVAQDSDETLDWQLSFDGYTCNIDIFGFLSVESVEGSTYLESFNIYPTPPCRPPFDLDAYDESGNITDENVEALGAGETMLFFDFSGMDLTTRTFRLEFSLSSNLQSGEWLEDLPYNDDDGIWWEVSLQPHECDIEIHTNLYDETDGDSEFLRSDIFEIQGPCTMPFLLMPLEMSGNWDGLPTSLEIGATNMNWNFSNLPSGSEYYFEWHWSTLTHQSGESYSFTSSDFNETLEWNLSVSEWTCSVNVVGWLYDASSDHELVIERNFEFEVNDCHESEISLEGHDDIQGGTNELSWNLSGIPDGSEYILHWTVYQNEFITQYDYVQWLQYPGYDANHPFNFTLNEQTCSLGFTADVYVLLDTDWVFIVGIDRNSDEFTCEDDNAGPISISALLDGDWVDSPDSLSSGTTEMSLGFGGLDAGDYQINYWWWSEDGQENNESFWFNPSNLSQYSFNVSSGEWSCSVELNYELSVETVFGWTLWAGQSHYLFETPCDGGGEINLQSDADDDELYTWVLDDLDPSYQYAFEWFVQLNGKGISQYDNQVWSSGYGGQSIDWALQIDDSSVCEFRIMAIMLVNLDDGSGEDFWHEASYFDETFWVENGTCGDSEPIELLLFDENGNSTSQPTYLEAGHNHLAWDTSSLASGVEFVLHWEWGTESSSGYEEASFFASEPAVGEWDFFVHPWDCNTQIHYDLSMITLGGEHHISSNEFSLDSPCEDVQYDETQQSDIEVLIEVSDIFEQLDGDSNQTQIDTGENQLLLATNGMVEDYFYHIEMLIHFDGNLNVYESVTWLAQLNNESQLFNFSIGGFVCEVEVSTELFVMLPEGWSSVSSVYESVAGPCDGTSGDSNAVVPLYSATGTNGSWQLINYNSSGWYDELDSLPSGQTPMFWDFSSIWSQSPNDDSDYYVSFHVMGHQIFSGLSSDISGEEGSELGFWNLTLDPFACLVDIWIEVSAVSQFTGWHNMVNQWYFLETECADGGDTSLLVGSDSGAEFENYEDLPSGVLDLQWSVENLTDGYGYSLEWYYYVNGEWSGYMNEEWNSSVGNVDGHSISWNMTIHDYTCDISIHSTLHVHGQATSYYVESTENWASGPCEPPFSIDAYLDNGTVVYGPESLDSGTTQLHLDFSEMDPGMEFYVTYYLSSDSTVAHGGGEYVSVGNGSGGVWFNATMHPTDCSAHLQVSLTRVDNGWNWWGYYNFEFSGPCESLFHLLELDSNGSLEEADGNLTDGTNYLVWDTSNLDNATQYQLEWHFNSWSSSYSNYVNFIPNGSHIEWEIDLSPWDCHASLEAYLYEVDYSNSSGNQTLIYADYEFYEFEVIPCIDASLQLESFDLDMMEYYPIENITGEDLNDGSNILGWNLSSLADGYEYLLEWYVFRNGYLTNHEYQMWNSTSSEEPANTLGLLQWELTLDESTTCELDIYGSVHVFAPEFGNNSYSWHFMDDSSHFLDIDCEDPQVFDPVSVDSFQAGEWFPNPSLLEVGINLMRLDFEELADASAWADVGSTFLIESEWIAADNWSSYGFDYFWLDPAITSEFEFNITVGQWDCWAEVHYSVLLESALGYMVPVGDYSHVFDTNCLGGEVNLSAQQDGEWVELDFELVEGTNSLMWELTELAVGYDYAIEWAVHYNDELVVYDYEQWSSSSDEEEFEWQIAIDDSVCIVGIEAIMLIDTGEGNSSFPYFEIAYFSHYFEPSCSEYGVFDSLTLEAFQDGSWSDQIGNLTEGENAVSWNINPINPDLEYSIFWSWDVFGENGLGFSSTDSEENVDDWSTYWNISIPDWACSVEIFGTLEVGPSLDDSYWDLDHVHISLGAPCEDNMPTGNLSLLSLGPEGNWTSEPEFLTGGYYDMSWEISDMEFLSEYQLSWSAVMGGILISEEERIWTATSANSTQSWNMSVHNWFCGLEINALLEANTSFGWVTIVDRSNWISNPCEIDTMAFADSAELEMELIEENGTIYMQVNWNVEFDGSIRSMLDSYFGDGDGYLDELEAAYAESELLQNESSIDPPELLLNGIWPMWSETISSEMNLLNSSNAGPPSLSVHWSLYFGSLNDILLTTQFELSWEDSEYLPFDLEIYFYGNNQLELWEAIAFNPDNSTTQVNGNLLYAEYSVDEGDQVPGFEVTWRQVVPEPHIELLQTDPVTGEWVEPSNVTSWMSIYQGGHDFEFGVFAEGLSWQNYTVFWDVWIDGDYFSFPWDNYFGSGNQSVSEWQDSSEAIFQIYTDRFVCSVSIEARIYDSFGDLSNITYSDLNGDCVQPDLVLEMWDYSFDGDGWVVPPNVTSSMSAYPGFHDFEFRVSTFNTSWYSEWSVEWNVSFDGVEQEVFSGSEDVPNFSWDGYYSTFMVSSDRFVCSVEIDVRLIDEGTGEVHTNSVYDLAGDCVQPDLVLEMWDYSFDGDGWVVPPNVTSSMSAYPGFHDFEFRVSTFNTSWYSEWSVEWNVSFDGVEQEAYGGAEGIPIFSWDGYYSTFMVSSDRFVCSVEIDVRLIDEGTGEVHTNSVYDLAGDCVQPDFALEQYDSLNSTWVEPVNATYWSSPFGDYSFEFRLDINNLSWDRNYTLVYDVILDNYTDENMSWNLTIPSFPENFAYSHYFYPTSSYDVCVFSIDARVLDSDTGEVVSSHYKSLPGDCLQDSDGDAFHDGIDAFPEDPTEWYDYDGDGVGDNSDAFPWNPEEWLDTDGDGIGNNADEDDDGDGVNDEDDFDNDGDGVNDTEDEFPEDPTEWSDSDGDGVGDNSDDFPDDATETTDTDGDGIGDNADEDDDNDGTPDDLDDSPLNPFGGTDSDGDGVPDADDAFPNNKDEWADNDGDGGGDNGDYDDDNDGFMDFLDKFPFDPTEWRDSDRDGVGDNSDAFPDDPRERADSDGDGVGDNADLFPSDKNDWSDSDGDGYGDNSDQFPSDPSETVDSDGDGVGNNADAFPYDSTETKDSDGDGVGDNAQANGGVPIEPDSDDDGGLFGFLPGFSSMMGLASILGAAMLTSRSRRD